MMKTIVEYKFINEDEIYSYSFENSINAMRFQAEILKKYKNKLEYCIYK